MFGGPDVIVCPVNTHGIPGPTTPLLTMLGETYFIHLRMLASVPLRVVGEPAGSAGDIRTDIGNGLDRLFFGI